MDHIEAGFVPNHEAISDISKLKKIIGFENNLIFRMWQFGDKSIINRLPNLQFVGVGRESVLFKDPHDENNVIGLGWGLGEPHEGVLPFAESMHIHGIAQILFPEQFAGMHFVSGGRVRSSVREFIEGERLRSVESDISKTIQNQFFELGIDAAVDGAAWNFIKDGKNHKMYVDFINGDASSIENIDIVKVEDFFSQKYSISKEDLGKDSRWRDLLIHVRRLKELDLCNELLEIMSVSKDFDLGNEEYSKLIESFQFLNNQEDNERSRMRIKMLLSKAIDAILKMGYKYKDGRWQEPSIL